MEVPLMSGFLNIILTKLVSMAEEKYKLLHGMKDDMAFLERELRAISSVLEGQLSSGNNSLSRRQIMSMDELRGQAHKIEDCIDSLMYLAVQGHHVPLKHQVWSFLKQKRKFLKLAEELKLLKTMPAEEHERSNRYAAFSAQGESSTKQIHEVVGHADKLMGMDAAVNELLKHLADEPKKLKLISILGFPGSGKTILARALYDSEDGEKNFVPRAWVRASQLGAKEVLMKILRELLGASHTVQDISDSDDDQLTVDKIREHLENKRYFIVIDDMRTDLWGAIEHAFPRDDKLSSTIMVTTTVQPVAEASKLDNIDVHVHKMGRLDKEMSRELFVHNACLNNHSNYGHRDYESILEKCDGQALALVTVGKFLRKKGWPTGESCNSVCRRFRYHLLEDKDLERIREGLIHSYEGLPSHVPKACFMYFAMFPNHHPIKRKILMRLWLAEGFVEAQSSSSTSDLAEDNFRTLIEHSIIEPVDVSNNSKVKTCKTYGMMREFILSKSMSQGFIALQGNEKLETKPSYVRRLCFYNSSASATNARRLAFDFHMIRSLTVHGKASEAILEFNKYRLLRILDLEGCTADLGKKGLKDICNLCLLKYLSLGGTVTSLPKQIKKLRLLETLDLRKSTVTTILPKEVILLPCLIHLLGKFRLSSEVNTSKLKKLMSSGQSSLETLAGFITGECDALVKIMCHMTYLSKVEIWCDKTASSMNHTELKKAIQEFINYEEEKFDPRSLSLHASQLPTNFLDDIDAEKCYLTSLKLEGMLIKLPQFVLSLHGLTELCLESSREMTTAVLTKLGDLKELKYLKLKADSLREFIIKKEASFPQLLRLCLILKRPPLQSIIEDGALKYLVSLVVLCEKLAGLSGMRIQYLHSVTDITLYNTVSPKTMEEWESAANQHPRRPKIRYVSNDDTTASDRPTEWALI